MTKQYFIMFRARNTDTVFPMYHVDQDDEICDYARIFESEEEALRVIREHRVVQSGQWAAEAYEVPC